ncbi:MAG: hypothetical protein KDF59_07445 [Nitrosomonas sp.]|nr:hypothetical protein [Nitrosomonas sp.]
MSTLQNPIIQDKDETQTDDRRGSSAINRFTALLRILGAAALIFAMYSFLAKGWQNGNDSFRYLLLLGHTGVLAAMGLASGHYLKESKGARLLLVLALVSIPVNFAILGSFIYSQTVHLSAAHADNYPDYVFWSVDSLNTALLTIAGSLLILAPVVLLGFTVLARYMSTQLSLLFLFSNSALLLPVRDAEIIGLLVLALTGLVFVLTRKFAANQVAAKTPEGMIALSLQLLPLSVLAVRNLWLYSPNVFLFTVFCLTVFLLLRQVSFCLETNSKFRTILDIMTLAPALLIVLPLSSVLSDLAFFPNALVLPTATLVSALMIYDISRRNTDSAGVYRMIAMSEILLGQVVNLALFDGLLATLACILIGAGLLVYGYTVRQRSLFAGGAALIIAGMLQQLIDLAYRFDLGNWASFAILGMIAILAASVIESQGSKIKHHVSTWKNTFQQWER